MGRLSEQVPVNPSRLFRAGGFQHRLLLAGVRVRRSAVEGHGHRGVAVRAVAVTAVAALASGCGVVGGSSTTLRPLAKSPYGVGSLYDSEERVLVGTAPWCVTEEPVRLTGLEWQEDGGVSVAGFAVVNQPAEADRIGADRGELAAWGLSGTEREVTTRCADDTDETGSVTYLVLVLDTAEPWRVTYGKGLVAHWVDDSGNTGAAVDELSVLLCPPTSPSCDDDDLPAS